jgi:hypothetical protein
VGTRSRPARPRILYVWFSPSLYGAGHDGRTRNPQIFSVESFLRLHSSADGVVNGYSTCGIGLHRCATAIARLFVAPVEISGKAAMGVYGDVVHTDRWRPSWSGRSP